MKTAFQDNGCYKMDGSLNGVHDTIDSTIKMLYTELLGQGYELNEVLAMLTLAVCDVRTDIALDNKFEGRALNEL